MFPLCNQIALKNEEKLPLTINEQRNTFVKKKNLQVHDLMYLFMRVFLDATRLFCGSFKYFTVLQIVAK